VLVCSKNLNKRVLIDCKIFTIKVGVNCFFNTFPSCSFYFQGPYLYFWVLICNEIYIFWEAYELGVCTKNPNFFQVFLHFQNNFFLLMGTMRMYDKGIFIFIFIKL
jgi:hypothetical protein